MTASNRSVRTGSERQGGRRSALMVAGVLLASAVAASSPAVAGGRSSGHSRRGAENRHERVERHEAPRGGHDHRAFRYGYGRGPIVHHRAVGRFDVPRAIGHRRVAVYDPYFVGRAWYRPHGHLHAVYYFPVWTAGRWVYEPHFYCNGHLHVDRGYVYADPDGRPYVGGYLDIGGPRFRVRVGF